MKNEERPGTGDVVLLTLLELLQHRVQPGDGLHQGAVIQIHEGQFLDAQYIHDVGPVVALVDGDAV